MKFIYVIIILLVINVVTNFVYCDVEVWLTVKSSLTFARNRLRQRIIEMNWRNAPNYQYDWIGLFDSDVESETKLSEALLVIKPRAEDGKHITNVQFPVHIFDAKDVGRVCLGFYIVYGRMKNVIKKNCIKLNSKWMEENFDKIHNRRVSDLMIPGTHNSGSYYEGYQNNGIIQGRIDMYTICQDENIFNQLMYGIRYIDLRMMFEVVQQDDINYGYWIAHDKFRMNNTVNTVLKDVKKFLASTTKEVVIIDFHRFPKGFDSHKEARHKMLLNYVEYYLGSYLSTASYYDVTFEELVNSGKRLIVGYKEYDIERPKFLYPPVRHLWAETDDINRLHEYLAKHVCHRGNHLIAEAAMAQLTPKVAGVIFDSYRGLRNLASRVNGQVTKWFRDEWSTCANIVATDFFLGNNIIEVAIDVLKRKT